VECCQEGAGVTVRVDGLMVHVGTGAYLARRGVDVTTLTGLAHAMAQRGSTPVLVAVDRVAAGAIEVGASPDDSSRQSLCSTELANEMAQRGSTPVLVAVDRVAAGAIEVGASPADSARQALGSLELAEVRLHLATSDHGQRARWLAVALGLDPAQASGDLSEE